MLVQLESTTKIVEVTINGQTLPARVWEGTTAMGVPCHAFITCIAVANDADQSQFERELIEQKPPSEEVAGIPMRMIF
jgi:hypothetical protein